MRTTKIPSPSPANLWIHALGARVGRSGGSNTTIRLGAYRLNGSGNPAARAGLAPAFTASALMVDNTGGASIEANVTEAFRVNAGETIALGILGTSADWAHGQDASGATMYYRSGLAALPDPSGYTSSDPQGTMSVWAVGEENVAPDVPINRAPSTTQNTLTPTFAGDYRDDNEALPGFAVGDADLLKQYQIQLRQVGSGTLKWDSTYSASSGEQDDRRFSRGYAGSALSPGVSYEWRCRVSDQFGSWSSWSSWLGFAVNGGGFVTLDGTPTGKQLSTSPGPFQFRWNHANALSTNAVQIRLLQSGIVIATSPIITKTVASSALPGTLDSITWGQTAFANLTNGQAYQYEIRGRDTGNLWSDYSDPRAFSINAFPNTPTNLSPANGAPTSVRPLLQFKVIDPDNTPGAGGLTAEVRIKSAAGSLLFTRTAIYNAGNGFFEYQTTPTDLASFATYRWDARGRDGTLDGAYSTERTFVYGQGPTVTVTAPTEAQVLATNQPAITWTAASQAKRRVRIFRQGTDELLHDSLEAVTAVQTYTPPAGPLHDGDAVYATVEVTDTTPLTGTSSPRNFSIDFPTPATITGFIASPEFASFDPPNFPSAVRLTWDVTAFSPSEFIEYTIYRRPLGGTAADDIVLARITSSAQIAWVDYLPASGQTYTYGIRQVILQGTDVTESDRAEAIAEIQLAGVVLADVLAGGDRRVALRYVSGRGVAPKDDRTKLMTWGTKPVILLGTNDWLEGSGTYRIGGDSSDPANPEDYMAALRSLRGVRPDKSPVVVCYRDERGRRFFASIEDLPEDDKRLGRYEVKIGLTEVDFAEGSA